jgi:hypothetical protein
MSSLTFIFFFGDQVAAVMPRRSDPPVAFVRLTPIRANGAIL